MGSLDEPNGEVAMTLEIENDDICIEYEITNESFDHDFGRETRKGFQINSIKAYIPALNDWLDVGHMSEFVTLAFNMVAKKESEAA